MANTQKKQPWVAFLLSILLTGAGLAYLGKWGWAFLNLFAAIGICVAAAFIYPDVVSPLSIGIGVGSAVMAKNLAEKMNKDAAASLQPTAMTAPPPPIVLAEPKPVEPVVPVVVTPTSVTCSKCAAVTEPGNFCSECGEPLS